MSGRRHSTSAVLLAAAALAVALSFVPYGRTVTYPIRLFVTYVHESSHVLAALLTGGNAAGMRVAPDGSGVAFTRGGHALVVASAGYLGTTLFGAALLLASRRRAGARRLLTLLAAATLLATLLLVAFSPLPFLLTLALAAALAFLANARRPLRPAHLAAATVAAAVAAVLLTVLAGQGAAFTWLAGCALGAALLLAGLFLSPGAAHLLLAFLAIQCCLAATTDLITLLIVSSRGHTHSDALIMQEMTGVPAVLWAAAWTVVSLTVLAVALRTFTRAAATSGSR